MHNIYEYDARTIQRLEQIFVLDQSKEYVFNSTDLLKIFVGFERLCEFWRREKYLDIIA